MKFTKNFLKERFALTPLQAIDYLTAFTRLQNLLQQTNPLNKPWHRRFYDYAEESLLILQALHDMRNKLQIACLLQKVFPKFLKSRSAEAAVMERSILSIHDHCLWPAYVYEDWNKHAKKNARCSVSPNSLRGKGKQRRLRK